MANTYLTNLDFVPETFKAYVDGETAKQSNFLQSEAVADAGVDLKPIFGNTVTLPMWDALSGADELKSATAPTANALSTSMEVAPILERRKVFGSNDLVASFAGANPFQTIGQKFAKYWAERMDEVLVASALGSAAGIDALSAGSVVLDISAGVGAAAVIDADVIIDAQALGGERFTSYKMIVMHSKTLAALRKQNLITNVPNSDGTRVFAYYGDCRVVVSDTAGMDAGAGVYNTLLVAPGAFGMADGTNPLHVLEADREISHADVVGSSKRYVLAPRGAKFIGTPAGATASNVELATAGNWTLGVADQKLFGVRVIKHKVA